MFYVKKA